MDNQRTSLLIEPLDLTSSRLMLRPSVHPQNPHSPAVTVPSPKANFHSASPLLQQFRVLPVCTRPPNAGHIFPLPASGDVTTRTVGGPALPSPAPQRQLPISDGVNLAWSALSNWSVETCRNMSWSVETCRNGNTRHTNSMVTVLYSHAYIQSSSPRRLNITI